MDESLKGVLITVTLIGIFITCILNFIILFPQEQGVVFTNPQDTAGYIVVAQNNDTSMVSALTTIQNQTSSAFNQWDITQGFMGSNQIKQNQGGIFSQITNIFSSLKILTNHLFGQSPAILYTIAVLTILVSVYVGYLIYKFIRTGN